MNDKKQGKEFIEMCVCDLLRLYGHKATPTNTQNLKFLMENFKWS